MTRVEVRRIAEGEGGSNVHGSKKVRFEKGVSEGRRIFEKFGGTRLADHRAGGRTIKFVARSGIIALHERRRVIRAPPSVYEGNRR